MVMENNSLSYHPDRNDSLQKCFENEDDFICFDLSANTSSVSIHSYKYHNAGLITNISKLIVK
jgi:hypothetical protein